MPGRLHAVVEAINRKRRRALGALAAWAGLPVALPALAQPGSKPLERTGGPYVPTPWAVVDQMILTGSIGAADFVMDLGCGDGRLVIAAAKRQGARGYGVDIDPELVGLANDNALKEGVSKLVRFEQRDIFETDVREATVLTLYVLPSMMMKLRPRFLSDLRPGTRIVAHDYHFNEWRPDSQITFEVPEKQVITGVPSATVSLWTIPVRLDGRWRLSAPAASGFDSGELALRQMFQDFEGSLGGAGRPVQRLDATSLRGREFRFAVPVQGRGGRGGRALFRGRLYGDRMDGTIESSIGGNMRFGASKMS